MTAASLPPTSPARACPRSVTFTGAFAAVANAIVTSLATAATPVALSGAGLNGASHGGPYTGNGTTVGPRQVTVTTSANAGSYAIATPIVVTGTDRVGNIITDTLTLTATGGGETVATSKGFATVTEIDIPAMVNTGGAFTFGLGDCVMPFRSIRVGTAGDVTYRCTDGKTDTLRKMTAGEQRWYAGIALSSAASTTAQDITLGE